MWVKKYSCSRCFPICNGRRNCTRYAFCQKILFYPSFLFNESHYIYIYRRCWYRSSNWLKRAGQITYYNSCTKTYSSDHPKCSEGCFLMFPFIWFFNILAVLYRCQCTQLLPQMELRGQTLLVSYLIRTILMLDLMLPEVFFFFFFFFAPLPLLSISNKEKFKRTNNFQCCLIRAIKKGPKCHAWSHVCMQGQCHGWAIRKNNIHVQERDIVYVVCFIWSFFMVVIKTFNFG